jgi:hypothetical protein
MTLVMGQCQRISSLGLLMAGCLVTNYHSLTGTIELMLLSPAGLISELEPRPHFLREEPPLLVSFFTSLSNSSSS